MSGDRPDGERLRVFAAEPFAVLATHGPDRRLDLVPCCFAVVDRGSRIEVVTAVDHKPKRHRRLARLANVARDPNVSLLADGRDPDDWSRLWWIRVQGVAEVIEVGPGHEEAVEALATKYAQYRETPPDGPVIRVEARRWAGWGR